VNELDAWVAAACAELGLRPEDVSAKAVLDVARDVAHQVLRPGAPVSAYLMGVAVGRGADPSDVADRLSALALAWPSRKAAGEAIDGQSARKTDDGRSAGKAVEGENFGRLDDVGGAGQSGDAGNGRSRAGGVGDPPIP
jgi:Domain of unknown function (DUF6457)